MHVIRAKADPTKMGGSRTFATGSGLNQMAASPYTDAKPSTVNSKPASQRSVPPSTRQLARDAAAFYGEEPGTVSDQAMAQARALKHGLSNRPPSTRQFAQAYKAFYDVPEMG